MSTLKSKFISAPVNGPTVEPLILQTNNLDRVSIDGNGVLNISNGQVYKDANGNVGFGTSSPTSVLDVLNAIPKLTLRDAAGRTFVVYAPNSVDDGFIGTTSNHALPFRTNNAERARITAAGDFQFNNGYGSVATAFGCRAWVNFNGTTNVGGFCTIRASGNVTSVTDNGTGDYTVNLTNAMPDANYSAVFGADGIAATEYRSNVGIVSQGTSTLRIRTGIENTSGANQIQDRAIVCVAIFR